MFRFVVYGKPNCSICDNRKETIVNCCNKLNLKQKTDNSDGDFSVDFIDGSTPEGMTDMCLKNIGLNIPSVLCYDDDTEVKRWIGPKDTPSMRDFKEIVENVTEKQEIRL